VPEIIRYYMDEEPLLNNVETFLMTNPVHRQHTLENLDKLVADMDSLNMGVMVNLSGFRGKFLEWSLDNVKKHYANRFVIFLNINFENLDDPGWPGETLTMMEEAVKQGVKGLKVYKGLGLTDSDNQGNRIAVDDPRLDPIWAKCGELGIPVLIHSGEPVAFWQPKDKHNERWLDYSIHHFRRSSAVVRSRNERSTQQVARKSMARVGSVVCTHHVLFHRGLLRHASPAANIEGSRRDALVGCGRRSGRGGPGLCRSQICE